MSLLPLFTFTHLPALDSVLRGQTGISYSVVGKKKKKENNLWLDVQGEGEGILCSKDLSLKVHYHKIQICDQVPKPGVEAGAGALWGLCKHLPLRGPG